MLRDTHALGGAAAWTAAAVSVGASPGVVLLGAPIAAAAGLLPDIDHHGSTVTRSLGFVTGLVYGLVDRTMGGHRAGAHSIVVGIPLFTGAAAAPAVFLGWPWWLVVAVLLGAASHTALDCLTGAPGNWDTAGCAVLWPLSRRRYGVPLMRTGSVYEVWLLRPLLVGVMVLAVVQAVS